jgi:GlpG protein
MRQIGTLPTQDEATRFADYLLTQGVEVKAEPESSGWGIWVRDENQLDQARVELGQFEKNPADERYHAASRTAATLRREEQQKRDQVRRNTHEMRDRWQRPIMQRRPLTVILIALCVFVGVVSNFGKDWSIAGELSFAKVSVNSQGLPMHARDGWRDIKGLQFWRLVTPIFIHFGMLHLAFNSYWVFILGGMIEERRNTWLLGAMVLALAVISNVAEYSYTGNPAFGGMSGVVYGLFGYIWMKMQFDPRSGFFLDTGTIVVVIAWLFLCMAGVIPNVANTAHVAGLLTGMAMGYLPSVLRSGKR